MKLNFKTIFYFSFLLNIINSVQLVNLQSQQKNSTDIVISKFEVFNSIIDVVKYLNKVDVDLGIVKKNLKLNTTQFEFLEKNLTNKLDSFEKLNFANFKNLEISQNQKLDLLTSQLGFKLETMQQNLTYKWQNSHVLMSHKNPFVHGVVETTTYSYLPYFIIGTIVVVGVCLGGYYLYTSIPAIPSLYDIFIKKAV